MSFISVLEKVGKAIAEGVLIVSGAEPIIQGLTGSASKASTVVQSVGNDLNSIAQVVTQVEAVAQTPGTTLDKVAASVPLVSQILQTSELVSGHQIADPVKFQNAASLFVQATQALLASLSSANVKTSGAPAPSVALPSAAAKIVDDGSTKVPVPPVE